MRVYVQSNPAVSSIHIIWGPMALLIIAAAGFFKDFLGLLPQCIFHRLTDVPCLTCGATRSLVALSQFDIASSFLLNPMLLLLVVGVVAFSLVSLYSLISKKGIAVKLNQGQKRALRIGIIGLFITNWVYLVAAGK
jgi:hypothetical protein